MPGRPLRPIARRRAGPAARVPPAARLAAAVVPAVLLLAIALAAASVRAQLADDATVSTRGTQFVDEPDEEAEPTEAPEPEPPPPEPAPPKAAAEPPEPAPEPEPPRYPTVVVLLDTSDSMLNRVPGSERTRLDEAKSALEQVLAGMSPETRVQLWTFNTRMKPVPVDGVKPGRFVRIGAGDHREALIERVRAIRTAGGTNLFQSVVKALRFFDDPRDQRLYRSGERFPVLVLVSDGEDGGKTRETLETVLEARAERPLVTINAIGFKVERTGQWFRTLCRIATRPEGCATAGDEAQLRRMLESFYQPPPGD